jgi:4-hydroxybenzoate polyprenyltransferase
MRVLGDEQVLGERSQVVHDMMDAMRNWFLITRPLTSALPGIFVFGAAWVSPGLAAAEWWAPALAFVLTACFGFVVNDIYDAHIGKDTKRTDGRKPIADGRMRPSVAKAGALILATLALGLAFAGPSLSVVGWITAVLALVSAYSWLAHRYPLMKGLITAILAITPIVMVVSEAGAEHVSQIAAIILLVLFVFSREIVMDARDTCGDRRIGMETIAARLGEGRAFNWGWAGMVSSAALIFIFSISRQNIILMVCSGAALAASVIMMLLAQSRADRRQMALFGTNIALAFSSVATVM